MAGTRKQIEALEKFTSLLRDLFKFDCSDLDFGIYRIMNYKRDVIEKFISTDLPKTIADELDCGSLADQSHAAAELTETANQITETLGKDALDADGNLADAYHDTPLGKTYLDLQGKAANAHGREALEATIFNHLYAFFSRYYQDGDFISKRRYSKRQKYAIPYNGEEVYLHWANHDQYYVKTAEHFHDYTFTSRGVTVHFKLTVANVEQNNVKGDKRLFLPRVKEIDWDERANELVIPFEFRPLTDQETVTYGKKNQQEKVIAFAIESIPKQLSPSKQAEVLGAITAERHKNSDGQPVSFLEHHLRQYTRRNTSDFFIHKDLKGFLSRELDFYLKNEVLNLDDMEAAGEDRSEGWFQVLRVIKAVGSRIIDFLDQIESFQKMLWEKRKFVTETQYCITVGTIDESFYPDIAACDGQWAEWKELFHIDEDQSDLFSNSMSKKDRRVAFLSGNPSLVIDTKFFSADFAHRVLSELDDLDENTDGLLVHGENFQALNLLLEKHRNEIKCTYIDPPYNTGDDEFLYRDQYQHASWLGMMDDRLRLGARLLSPESIHLVSIGKDEADRLGQLLSNIFSSRFVPFIWKSRAKPTNAGNAKYRPQVVAEFILANPDKNLTFRPMTSGEDRTYPNVDELGQYRTTTILTSNRGRYRRETLRFEIAGYTPPPDKRWKAGEEEIQSLYESGRIGWGDEGEPHRKIYDGDEEDLHIPLWTFMPEEITGTAESGKAELSAILGKEHGLDSVKPKELLQVFLSACIDEGIVLDYFAGSGTTAHAVIETNREDGQSRKFILCDQAALFDSILVPRIKKIMFAPVWKGGKPKRMATMEEADRSPQIVKYMRLESYEDTLNNIAFDGKAGQGMFQFDDYLLQYMLKWETRKSETLLNVEQLAKPFSYKLTVAKGDDTIEKVVDLPETFNYLLGLHVSTRKVYDDDGRRYLVYHGRIDHRRIAVIWRETEGWQKTDFERDKRFVAEQKLAEGADEVFVNGDSFIPNAKALEPVFKARMFSTVEA